jgi:hypothetical protein
MDAIHDGGVAGLADGNDSAVLDAEIAFDDAERRCAIRWCRPASPGDTMANEVLRIEGIASRSCAGRADTAVWRWIDAHPDL